MRGCWGSASFEDEAGVEDEDGDGAGGGGESCFAGSVSESCSRSGSRSAGLRVISLCSGARGRALEISGARANHFQIVVGAALVFLPALFEPGVAPTAALAP